MDDLSATPSTVLFANSHHHPTPPSTETNIQTADTLSQSQQPQAHTQSNSSSAHSSPSVSSHSSLPLSSHPSPNVLPAPAISGRERRHRKRTVRLVESDEFGRTAPDPKRMKTESSPVLSGASGGDEHQLAATLTDLIASGLKGFISSPSQAPSPSTRPSSILMTRSPAAQSPHSSGTGAVWSESDMARFNAVREQVAAIHSGLRLGPNKNMGIGRVRVQYKARHGLTTVQTFTIDELDRIPLLCEQWVREGRLRAIDDESAMSFSPPSHSPLVGPRSNNKAPSDQDAQIAQFCQRLAVFLRRELRELLS